MSDIVERLRATAGIMSTTSDVRISRSDLSALADLVEAGRRRKEALKVGDYDEALRQENASGRALARLDGEGT